MSLKYLLTSWTGGVAEEVILSESENLIVDVTNDLGDGEVWIYFIYQSGCYYNYSHHASYWLVNHIIVF